MVIESLQYASIVLEIAIAIIAVMIATIKKKKYGWGLFITFAIYVFYDFVNLVGIAVNTDLLYVLFFMATLSALLAIITLYRKNEKR